MSDVIKGANFFIVPKVDRQSATQAEAQIENLVRQAAAAAEQGNEKVLNNLNAKVARKLGQSNPEVKVNVSYQTNSATGQIKEIRTLSASALDPLIKDYKKMVQIQGESALSVKKEIAIQKDKLNALKQQALTLKTHSKSYRDNAAAQSAVTAETTRLEGVLRKVTTLASLKGQLRDESQRLSMMSQFNVVLDEQGRKVVRINQDWVNQKNLVKGLSADVRTASAATQSFGAKVSGVGKAIQASFGIISAIVASLAALTGAVGALTGRTKDIQSLKLTFDGLGMSVAAQNDILAASKAIALSYGVSLRKVEGAFKRLGPAILESGGTINDTSNAIKSISARTTMLGLNTEQTGRYIEAFAQVMGKGKLQGEELNQQFAELDGGLRGQLKNWLAANKGIQDFEESMKNGEITSGVFLEAFEAINEEIRVKFLRSIGDTQQAIEKLGEEGGMTLNQLNAKMQTLTSIGLEGVGKALAPLGKELMKIYAAFVQVFTKIATEMPGIQGTFRFLGKLIGINLKLAINGVLLIFQVFAQVLNVVIELVAKLYNYLKSLPVIGGLIKGMEDGFNKMNTDFDKVVDNMTRLSDETTGAKTELEKYNDEMKNLDDQLKAGTLSQEEYYRKVKDLEQRRLDAKKKALATELEMEEAKIKSMLEKRKAQLDQEKIIMKEKIDAINEAKDAEVKAIDASIEKLKNQKTVITELYNKKIQSVKDASAEAIRAIEDETRALQEQKDVVQESFKSRLDKVKSFYAAAKAEMTKAHDKEMSQIDARISKLRQAQGAAMDRLGYGPEKEKLDLMKMADLRRQIAQEGDAMRRQELKAQLESMQNEGKRRDLEKSHAAAMSRLLAAKAAKEKEQAEEKKKLDEEEQARAKELSDLQQKTLKDLNVALRQLAADKRAEQDAERKGVADLKKTRDEQIKGVMEGLDEEKKKRKEVLEEAKTRVKELESSYEQQLAKVREIEVATDNKTGAEREFGAAVDTVTDGALERQLAKVRQIRREMASTSKPTGSSSGSEARFAGGPVAGGTSYTVNELGREGFLSASGRMTEIKAPAWGQWKAPSSGTVIPAHIWKGIKAGEQAQVNMPRNLNPGNAISRSISTINSRQGDNIQNTVTIQAANPVQAANNMMVEMTRLRRRRFG